MIPHQKLKRLIPHTNINYELLFCFLPVCNGHPRPEPEPAGVLSLRLLQDRLQPVGFQSLNCCPIFVPMLWCVYPVMFLLAQTSLLSRCVPGQLLRRWLCCMIIPCGKKCSSESFYHFYN